MTRLALSLRSLQAQPDGRLTQLAREGHEPAFEALVRRYRNELLCYCRRLMPGAANAEDTLQQALLQAWRALKAGAEVRDIRPWLYRIAHNVAISHLRAAGATPQEIDDEPGSFDIDQVVQQRLRARAALVSMASLPELQRQVFVRTTLDGASHEEVATALGITNGAVRGLIFRARAALRAAAAAVVPTPALSWAIRHAATRSKQTHAALEAAVGGGGAGMAGLIAKGGALIAITGAVAGGGMIVSPTTPHHHSKASQADLYRAGSSSISATLLAHRAPGGAAGAKASASASGARGSSDSRSGRDGSSGSTGGSGGVSMSDHDGGSSGGSDDGSRRDSTGSSSGSSDGGSSSATTAQSSGGTFGGSSEGSSIPNGPSSSGGPGSSGSDGGTSGGQVMTATTTSSETSGSDGGSSGSSGSGDTTTSPSTH